MRVHEYQPTSLMILSPPTAAYVDVKRGPFSGLEPQRDAQRGWLPATSLGKVEFNLFSAYMPVIPMVCFLFFI